MPQQQHGWQEAVCECAETPADGTVKPCSPCSDIATIATNALAFNGEGELAEDAAALAAYLTAVLQGQVRFAGLLGLPAPAGASGAAAAVSCSFPC